MSILWLTYSPLQELMTNIFVFIYPTVANIETVHHKQLFRSDGCDSFRKTVNDYQRSNCHTTQIRPPRDEAE